MLNRERISRIPKTSEREKQGYLVITRKINESIRFGNDVIGYAYVTVVKIGRDETKLVFNAPGQLIVREEMVSQFRPNQKLDGNLLLIRKVYESTFVSPPEVLGNEDKRVQVKVLGVSRNRVKIGLKAPVDVYINKVE